MKINSIVINSFGKLKNFPLSFTDGFNVLYGENEQGKSTIMAFIRMMFYGSARSDRDLSKNYRKKYSPWDGSKMSGSMEFTHEGVDYRLEKTFGATPKNDILKLWNQSTNEIEPLTEQREIGRRFFGMGEDAFERSVFIGQISSIINTDKDKENEIIQKLQNLVSSGDETQSYHLIDSRLQTSIEKIRSKGGKIGILDRLAQARVRLEDERIEAIQMEAEKERIKTMYQELLDRKAQEEKNLEERNEMLEGIRHFKRYRDCQRILARHREIEELELERDAAEEALISGDFKVDRLVLDEANRQLQDLLSQRSILQSKNDELIRQEKIMVESFPDEPGSMSKEQMDLASELQKKILAAKEEIRTLQFSLAQEEYAMKEAVQYETILAENTAKMEEYQRQTEELKKQLDQPLFADKKNRTEHGNPEKSVVDQSVTLKKIRIPVAGLLIGILSLLGFLAAGYLVHVLLYTGGIASILLVIILLTVYSSKKKKQREALFLVNETIKERDNQIQSTISFIKKEWDALAARQEKTQSERMVKNPLDQRSSAEISHHTETLKQTMDQTSKTIETEQSRLNEFFTRYQAASIEDLQTQYFKLQGQQNRRKDAIREIDSKREQIQVQLVSFKNLLQTFIENIRRMKSILPAGFSSFPSIMGGKADEEYDLSDSGLVHEILSQTESLLDISKDGLQKLTQQYYIVQNKNLILAEKTKALQDTLGSRTVEIVRQEFENIKSRTDNEISQYLQQEPSDEEQAELENQIATQRNVISSIDIALTKIKTEMVQTFLDKAELAMIIGSIKDNEKEQAVFQTRHAALALAKKQMEQSFLEMQQTFGPIVNKKTAEIFSRITNGKYQELLVTKDLNINFRDPFLDTTQEWQYLSGGTMDQVYFSLRLAIAGFFADQTGGLPLFIDDAFLQYDDSRTKESLLFLEEYAKKNRTQILFFTCHKNLFDQSGASANKINLSE